MSPKNEASDLKMNVIACCLDNYLHKSYRRCVNSFRILYTAAFIRSLSSARSCVVPYLPSDMQSYYFILIYLIIRSLVCVLEAIPGIEDFYSLRPSLSFAMPFQSVSFSLIVARKHQPAQCKYFAGSVVNARTN